MSNKFLTCLLVLSVSACASHPRNDSDANNEQDSLFDDDATGAQQRDCQPLVSRGGSATLGPEQAQVTVAGGHGSAVTDCDLQDAQATAAHSASAQQDEQAAREAELQRQLMLEQIGSPQALGTLPGGPR